jgi:outer membrane protein OmpA-like peptidoglycan-associated protein
MDGFQDEDGCPDPDNDKDGILDKDDKCPNEPETINGFQDDDGCPDKGPAAAVKIGREELETLKPIFFDTDRARVRHAFYNILGQIGLTLKAHPEIGRCAVEGHTDDTGPEEWNQKLSQLRAQSVVEFLVKKGVERNRLAAIGHGEKVPWTSNETEEGRAKNRSVIFHIEGINLEDQEKQERRRRVREHKEHKAAAERRARDEQEPSEPKQEEKPSRRQEEKPKREDKAPTPKAPAQESETKAPETKEPAATGRASVPAQPTGRAKTKAATPENPKSLRDLLKLPPGEGLDESPPAGNGPPDLPKRGPKR